MVFEPVAGFEITQNIAKKSKKHQNENDGIGWLEHPANTAVNMLPLCLAETEQPKLSFYVRHLANVHL